MAWSGLDIADWLSENRTEVHNQGADGLHPEGMDDGYLWLLAHVDLDYIEAYLLDVRSIPEYDEYRDYLVVMRGPWGREVVWHNQSIAWNDDSITRIHSGVAWLNQLLLDYLERHN